MDDIIIFARSNDLAFLVNHHPVFLHLDICKTIREITTKMELWFDDHLAFRVDISPFILDDNSCHSIMKERGIVILNGDNQFACSVNKAGLRSEERRVGKECRSRW